MAADTSGEQSSGGIVRAYVDVLADLGVKDQVRARLPPELQALVDAPPPRSTWMPATVLRDLLGAIAAELGVDGVRRAGELSTLRSVMPALKPIYAVFRALGVLAPATVFSRMDSLMRSFHRGFDVRYVPDGERAGVLELRAPSVQTAAQVAALEGSLRGVFIQTGAQGTVAPGETLEGGRLVRVRLSW